MQLFYLFFNKYPLKTVVRKKKLLSLTRTISECNDEQHHTFHAIVLLSNYPITFDVFLKTHYYAIVRTGIGY